MATISKDPVENLSNLALFIANDVRSAMTASLVTSIANAWFHQFAREEQEKRFRTHPANNIVYAGLKALEEQAIVRRRGIGVYCFAVSSRRRFPSHRSKPEDSMSSNASPSTPAAPRFVRHRQYASARTS